MDFKKNSLSILKRLTKKDMVNCKMACLTCDHTMHLVCGNITQMPGGNDMRVFWCPRCGTLKTIDGISKPMLVTRVTKFVELLEPDKADDELSLAVLKYLRVTESIALPGDRR